MKTYATSILQKKFGFVTTEIKVWLPAAGIAPVSVTRVGSKDWTFWGQDAHDFLLAKRAEVNKAKAAKKAPPAPAPVPEQPTPAAAALPVDLASLNAKIDTLIEVTKMAVDRLDAQNAKLQAALDSFYRPGQDRLIGGTAADDTSTTFLSLPELTPETLALRDD